MKLRWFWDGPARRTWLTHAALGAIYTVLAVGLLRLLPTWTVPGAFAAFFYLIREVEGVLYSGKLGDQADQIDHLLDVVSPTVAGLLVAGVLWALGVHWR